MKLFEFQLVFEAGHRIVDLHNDYKCENIAYDFSKQTLKCDFKGESNVRLEFNGAIVKQMNLILKRTEDSSTLNSFYRGRFEENGTLLEYSKDGKGYYYLEFEDGDSLELHATKVILSVNNVSGEN